MKRKLLLTIGVNLLIVFAFAAGLFFLSKSVREKNDQISELRSQKNSITKAVDSMIFLRADAQNSEKYLAELNAFFITRDQLINFSKDITAMAGQNNLSQSLSFGEETPPSLTTPRKTSLNISFSGNSGDLKKLISLLKTLENSRYFLRFNGFDVNIDVNNLKANFNGQIFSF